MDQKPLPPSCLDVVPKFLSMLYDMVRCAPEYPQLIQWNDERQSFVVLDRGGVTSILLPRFFRNQTYQSFTRQLNMYGFTKRIEYQDDRVEFAHPNFQLGKPELLASIKRKSSVAHYHATLNHIRETQRNATTSYIGSIEAKVQFVSDRQSQITIHLDKLKRRYQDLLDECSFLQTLLQPKYHTQIQQLAAETGFDHVTQTSPPASAPNAATDSEDTSSRFLPSQGYSQDHLRQYSGRDTSPMFLPAPAAPFEASGQTGKVSTSYQPLAPAPATSFLQPSKPWQR